MSQPTASIPMTNPTGTFKPITTSTTIGAPPSTGGQQLVPPPSGSQFTSPSKEVNAASLCRSGQEMVQDVVQKTTDIFQWLKGVYLPNGTTVTQQMCQERRLKLEEHIRNVNTSFRKLLVIYDMVKEYKEDKPVEEFLPIEIDGEIGGEKPCVSEQVMAISEDHKEVIEQIQAKNQQLKEIIDHLRMIIWEINTMMAVRRS